MDRVSTGVRFLSDHQFELIGILLALSLIVFGVLAGTPLGVNSSLVEANSTAGIVVMAFDNIISRIAFGAVVTLIGVGYIAAVFKKKFTVLFSGLMTLSYLYVTLLKAITVGFTSSTFFFLTLIVVAFLVYVNTTEETQDASRTV